MSNREPDQTIKNRGIAVCILLGGGLFGAAIFGHNSYKNDLSKKERNFALTSRYAIEADKFRPIVVEGRESAVIRLTNEDCTIRVRPVFEEAPNGSVSSANYSYPPDPVRAVKPALEFEDQADLMRQLGDNVCQRLLQFGD